MTRKENLKKLVAENKIKKVIDLLMDIFKDTEEINSVILLSARFSDINNSIGLGITDNKTSRIEIAKITYSLLDLIDRIDDDQELQQNKTNTINVTGNNNQIYQDISNSSISDKIKPNQDKTGDYIGENKSLGAIAYDIPDEMLIEQIYRCAIRISPDKNLLSVKSTPTSKLEKIKISDIMEVELLETSINSAFIINSICSKEQVIEKEDFTEWLFDVMPKKIGKYSLILRVSIITIVYDKERKKQLVFEKQIQIKSDGLSKKTGFREISNSDNVNTTAQNSRRVFISYNHKDKSIADKLSNKLKLSGAKIIIDSEMMKAGENITNFIEKCILESDITLSIISNNSLLSSWVGIETINTFYHEKYSDKKFIACYTDDDFFDNRFRITATRKIDEKIKELDNLILEYMELKLDPTDLNNEKTRLFQLRNNLGDILQRLRNSLCIDINDNVFEDNVKRIISAINE